MLLKLVKHESQIPRLNRILAFKDLGFSLEQIGELLDDQVSLDQIQGMLRLKRAELQLHIESEKLRLARVETRIKQIEQEDKMSNYDIVVKKGEPIKVVSLREILTNYSAIGKLFNELIDYLHQHKITKFDHCAAIWHDLDYKESDVDGEAIIGIERSIPDTDRIKVYKLPVYDAIACIIHQGSYLTLGESYKHLLTWIEANDYKIIGSNREFYIQGGEEQDNESYITEIQFPVKFDL